MADRPDRSVRSDRPDRSDKPDRRPRFLLPIRRPQADRPGASGLAAPGGSVPPVLHAEAPEVSMEARPE
ncbi:MAG TPA: hypothetical protein VFI15_04600, partial [Candidatus Limnocylindrales bacterium]|nr:hypothetical protein [Candidatus Limnocylindrales bacterium]